MAALRVGFLGAGGIARTHARCLREAGGNTIVAVCATGMASAEKFSRECAGGSAAAFDRFDNMLKTCPMDALFVCVPPFAHAGEIEAAAARHIALFLEKPLALDVDRARSIAAAARSNGVAAHVGQHMRFGKPVRKLKAMLDSGEAGRPTLLIGQYFCNAMHGDWWRDVRKSGGQLFEQAIHVYDMACHFLGRPATVAAFMENLAHQSAANYSVEDTSAAVIRFDGGGIASIAASNCAIPGQWQAAFTVVCERVTATFASPTSAKFVLTEGLPAEEWQRRKAAPPGEQVDGPADLYLEQVRHFLAAARREETPVATVDEGLVAVELVAAAVKSAKQGGYPRKASDG